MSINYLSESEKYRPNKITTLLVGEAPPPNGKSYFYLPKDSKNSTTIKNDRSLPATIFCHYFKKRPSTVEDYAKFLHDLKTMGVFLVDIYDEPIKVRGSSDGEQKIVDAIPKLYLKLKGRGIDMNTQRTVFLLARNSYKKYIRMHYPKAELYPWIEFRMANIEKAP